MADGAAAAAADAGTGIAANILQEEGAAALYSAQGQKQEVAGEGKARNGLGELQGR